MLNCTQQLFAPSPGRPAHFISATTTATGSIVDSLEHELAVSPLLTTTRMTEAKLHPPLLSLLTSSPNPRASLLF